MKINIYTDWACSGNPGPWWRWSVIHIFDELQNPQTTLLSGQTQYTTNSQMELLSVIKSLEYMYQHIDNPNTTSQDISLIYTELENIYIWSIFWPQEQSPKIVLQNNYKINIYTDSKYVYESITIFIQKRKQNWRRLSNRKPVANKDLIIKLDYRNQLFHPTRNRVKWHADNKYNNLADQLATGKQKPTFILQNNLPSWTTNSK